MSHSSASEAVLLPFGSLTGVIPMDSVPQARVLDDFSSVIGCDRRLAELRAPQLFAGPEPASAAWPLSPQKGGGGIWL